MKSVPSLPSNSIFVPDWIKSNADWWAEGAISDSDFVSGIQYLLSSGMVRV